MGIRLVSFDLDGTFPDYDPYGVGAVSGSHRHNHRLEEQHQNFEITSAQVAEGDAFAYTGKSVAEIEALILLIPTIEGWRRLFCSASMDKHADCHR